MSPSRADVNRIRGVFKFAFELTSALIDKPVHYGQSFDRPTRKNLRKERHAGGKKVFTVDELALILRTLDGKPVKVGNKKVHLDADPILKAMVLLALNAGFGNTDIANLPIDALDTKNGWADFPRPKTWIHRRAALWPETVAAVKVAIAKRPSPLDGADEALAFLTKYGRRWVRIQEKRQSEAHEQPAVPKDTKATMPGTPVDAISPRFRKLLKSLEINSHRNFYCLRHCTETWGGAAKDQIALDFVMGHLDESIAETYRDNEEGISDDRLRAVSDAIRARAFSKAKRR